MGFVFVTIYIINKSFNINESKEIPHFFFAAFEEKQSSETALLIAATKYISEKMNFQINSLKQSLKTIGWLNSVRCILHGSLLSPKTTKRNFEIGRRGVRASLVISRATQNMTFLPMKQVDKKWTRIRINAFN